MPGRQLSLHICIFYNMHTSIREVGTDIESSCLMFASLSLWLNQEGTKLVSIHFVNMVNGDSPFVKSRASPGWYKMVRHVI